MIIEFVLLNFVRINKLMEIFLLNKQGLAYTIGIFAILTVSLLILMVAPQNSFAQPTTLICQNQLMVTTYLKVI